MASNKTKDLLDEMSALSTQFDLQLEHISIEQAATLSFAALLLHRNELDPAAFPHIKEFASRLISYHKNRNVKKPSLSVAQKESVNV